MYPLFTKFDSPTLNRLGDMPENCTKYCIKGGTDFSLETL